MYSYEDRLRTVKLYIKLGKRVGLTIRQLCYPTKNALKGWHRKYEQRLELRTDFVRRAKYTQAQKERAANHYSENGRCVANTIRALGYPSRALLTAWVREQRPEARARLAGRFQELTPAMKQSVVVALCTRQASAQAVTRK